MEDHLHSNLPYLVQNLMVEHILPQLVADGTLLQDDVDIIRHCTTQTDKVMRLVEVLCHRGEQGYQSFCSALQYDQNHVFLTLQQGSDIKTVTDTLDRLEKHLRAYYCHCLGYVSLIPWCDWFQIKLDKAFTPMRLVRGIYKGVLTIVMDCHGCPLTVEMCDLFSPHWECQEPKRLLMEGEPGIGKSTLCYKVVHNWARQSQDGAATESGDCSKKFSLVFLVNARLWPEEKDLYDVIKEQLLPEDLGIDKKQLKACVEGIQEEVLIVVDGYDEWLTVPKDLNKLLARKLLSRSTVLMTSRPAFSLRVLRHFDSILINTGYEKEQQQEYIAKFATELVSEVADFTWLCGRLENNASLAELCRNPLNLSILCMLYYERASKGSGVGELNTTSLYLQLHDFILSKTSERLNVDDEVLRQILTPLYQLAFRAITDDDVAISENVLTHEFRDVKNKEILPHLGFFRRDMTICGLRAKTSYTFTHKSFLEFFAGVHLSRLGTEERYAVLQRVIGDIKYGNTLEFLVGILQMDPEALEQVFQVWMENSYNSLSNIPDYRLSIHDVTESHKLHAILHWLCELDLSENVPLVEELGPSLLRVRQLLEPMSFVNSWCMSDCIDGYIRLCKACELYLSRSPGDPQPCRYEGSKEVRSSDGLGYGIRPQVILMGQCLHGNLVPAYQELLRELATLQYVSCVSIYNVTNISQLTMAIRLLRPGHVNSSITRIRLQFLAASEDVQTPERSLDEDSPPPRGSTAMTFGPQITGLRLRDCSHPGIIVRILEALPERNSHFLELRLSNCALDADCSALLRSRLPNWTNLEYLTLAGHALHVRHPEAMYDLLDALRHLTKLKELDLSHLPCKAESVIFRQLSRAAAEDVVSLSAGIITPGPPSSPPPSDHLQEDIALLLEALLRSLRNNLVTLWISYTALTHRLLRDLSSFIRGNAALQTFGLAYNLVTTECHEGFDEMFGAIATAPNLHFLSLRGTEVSHQNLIRLGEVLPKITNLRLFTNSPSPLHREQTGGIVSGLFESQLPSLSTIHLRHLAFAEGAMADFARSLHRQTALTNLKLSMHPGNYITDSDFAILFQALHSCGSLKQLQLRHFGISDEHMPALADVLLHNHNIQHMDLHHNKISGKGVELLLDRLSKRPKLLSLDLSDCSLTDFDCFIKSLRRHVCYLKVNWF